MRQRIRVPGPWREGSSVSKASTGLLLLSEPCTAAALFVACANAAAAAVFLLPHGFVFIKKDVCCGPPLLSLPAPRLTGLSCNLERIPRRPPSSTSA